MSFEMGPPFQMLNINKRYVCHNSQHWSLLSSFSKPSSHDDQYKHNCHKVLNSFIRLNPELNLDIYNLAIYDKSGTVFYEVVNHFLLILDNFDEKKTGRVQSATVATVGSMLMRREPLCKQLLLFRFCFRDTRGEKNNDIDN